MGWSLASKISISLEISWIDQKSPFSNQIFGFQTNKTSVEPFSIFSISLSLLAPSPMIATLAAHFLIVAVVLSFCGKKAAKPKDDTYEDLSVDNKK
ncbi:unnamed protein product [Caenorhabditis nigoni]